jgi:hypothetical protein
MLRLSRLSGMLTLALGLVGLACAADAQQSPTVSGQSVASWCSSSGAAPYTWIPCPPPSGSGGSGSTGSVTAAGTNGTLAQAVQGITGGVAVPVSAAALPLPAGAATAAGQNLTAAGTSATQGQGVQGVTGGVALSTTDSNILTAIAAQGVAPSGTGGLAVVGIYMSTNPTLTNGQASRLLLDSSGRLVLGTSEE